MVRVDASLLFQLKERSAGHHLVKSLYLFQIQVDALLKSFKYTIDIKINASKEAVIERLRALIRGQKFPMCVKKGMKISSANITTVCLSNSSKTECKCENQYAWSSEQCSKHGVCGHSQNGTCGCIASLPTDGSFCRPPPAPLKSFKYTIDIKINASKEAVIERLRALIPGQKFPMCVKKGMKISSANITTVCMSNSSKTECKCENQYSWSSEQCSKHGVCGHSQNGTCGCIASLPTDGSFCRPPPASLKLFKYTIDIKINASKEAVIERLRALIRGQKFPICVKKGMKISSANITTVCLSNSSKTECKCENQYSWPSEQCSKHGVCGYSQNGTCGCIASLPTDGAFCRPPPAPLKSFKYTIDIKINASKEAVIERLRALIHGQKFPICVKKGMKISSANITTVCLSNSTKTKCKCENQYSWPSEQCSKHGVCGHSQNGKCGCITSLPTDGSFCRPPPAPLKSFKYTIDIKINASKEAVIERLRALIRGQKFPMCVKKGMKISSANITTVCMSNSSKTECKCENQYSWPSEQCSKHGVCGHSQNGTCGCIASLPTDGSFCRPPPASLKLFKYTIDIKINASKEAVIERLRALIRGQKFPICVKKGMKISSANITTVCLSNSSKTECKCENQYSWSSEQCSKHGVCGHSQNGTCGCIASLPTDRAFCRPPPAPLKSFKYTIDIKINASKEAVIERLRALIRGQKFPICVKKGMKISSANITTVCLSNSSKTECKCENQYSWSSEQCSKHGVCGHSQNGTCGCIASLPTDGAFCRPPPAPLKSFKYTIDIKINASKEAVIERLRALIRGQKFPICVKKGMKISSANITTVCLSISNKTKCKCENQYSWPSEQCSKHGVCGHSQNGTCGCIASLPTDGAFCRPPPAPLKSFKYTIDIKINASKEAVIERLRALIRGQKFPMCVKKGMKISSANITTAKLNASVRINTLGPLNNALNMVFAATVKMVNVDVSLLFQLTGRSAGHHLVKTSLKLFKYTIDIKINSSKEAVIERLRALIRGQKFPICVKKGMKISSANITTVCLSNSSKTECKCENQYSWPSEQCSKHGVCGHSQNGTCGCIASLPTDGAFCRPPPAPLKSFKYTIDIKINASKEAVIERLRALIRGQKFPMCVKKGMKISSANITTVCMSNSSKTECKCENQYSWPSEQCSKHGVCGHSQNGTCGCIASLPTDGSFCRPPPASLKLFKYTIDIKINASKEAVIERLRALIRGQKFPICVKKGMKISSANITAVCLSNSSKTECKCENQYSWSSEQCSKHGVCGHSQNGTCGCIASLPTDGSFCRPPPASLKLFKYTIDIKINASKEAVIERLRALIRGQKFPICVKKGMKISSANITTVCLSNSSKTECKCENQYSWPSEQCSKHGVCGHSQNGTCGCIASLPTDGAFCRPPPAPLKSFKYTIDIKINASKEAVIERLRALIRGQKFPMCVKKGMKISSANITTVCMSNSSKTECKCENQYSWPSEQCSKHGVCGHSQNGTCGCIASLPTDGAFCRPPPAPLKSFKYTIDIKINASKEAVIERLRALIRGQKFPMCVKKGMKISSANITTVCMSNSSKTECKCENQYSWPSEQCSKHGVCGHSQNGTCGCIASLPTDGSFCRPPPASLKLFKYTIDIKINASKEAVIERLRALIRGQKFPICVKKGMKISSANITAVCLSNSSKTECKCENQYSWSSEQCSKHGVCGHSQNGTCGCIASLPTDGSFCRPPPASLKLFKYTIDIKINASKEAVIERLRALIRGQKFPICVKKGMKISSANITTVCLSNSSKTECKCENQYSWPSEQCSKHGVCGHSQNGTCGCIASLPTDGAFCRPPPAPLKSFKYTIDIKINASKEAVIERLRALIRGQKFPMCVKKGMKISSANITTVCMSNSSKTECKCENQYSWPSEQCSKHGVCGHSQNGTCGCIASLPTDGAFCRPPPAPLKSFKYTIDIKINASKEAVIERLRALIRGQKFPICVKKGMKISSANITTVCLSNSNKTKCKCENQYSWPSEQCSKHGVCGHSQNGTCGCIASLPTDGSFCRPPPAPLKSFKYTIDIKINASKEAVIERLRALIRGQKFPMCVKKGMKISSANITTVCLSNSSKTECKCENQYAWSSEQCSKHGVCGHSQNGTCGCIASLPTDGSFCRPPPAPLKSFKYTIDIKINASKEAVIERLRALIRGQKFPMCVKKGMKISSANITTASLKLFKYTIDIKINASKEAVIERLRALIRGQKFPICVKKDMKISSANITTVCLSNSSKTECKCENQYSWPSEQCSKHGVCGHSQNGTCGCIASLPTDGAFCRPPPAPLKSFKYTIDIKINASKEAVIERLRALIRGQKFPICVKKGMKISSANITTVCMANSSKTECKCENQYSWPSEQCSKHGVCGHSQNGTCGCIASLPTDGSFCRPPPAPLKSFKYTIDIKINASREAVIERLRALIRGQKFPMCVKKGMKISSANITTVCLSNSNKTECKCENQYAWSSEQCSKHGVCGHNQNGKCGCISSLPTDGSFCRPPPAPLKSFKYTIDIKINASKEAVIERLRALIRGQKFPICVKKGMKISSANITTVCMANSSKTECKCENQYSWPSEQCSKHGVCGHSQNGTCGCIASLPTDGAFCRPPPAPLKSFKYTIDIKINASKEAVIERLRALIRGQKFPMCVKKGMKISSANITTVCLSNSSKTECKCENQYAWSSEQCSKHGVCGHSQNGTCGCIASLPTDGSFCRPPPAPLKSFKYTIDIKINASKEAVIERLRALIRGQKFPMCVKKGMKISSANITTASLKFFKYTIDIKINASKEAVIERLRALIRGQKFPICVKKDMKISSANITTVCLSNSSKTECKCENQYSWPSEQCSKHGVCGHSQNGTCGCIASLPTDGAFCRPPPAPLKSFKYTIDIKINASKEAVIERLRALIRGQKFPMCVKKGMKISSANITTVCMANSSKTECKCENQYSWPSEQCSKHGVCGHSQNGTCGCIASLPTDGAFCRPPPAPLKSFKYTIDIKINASKEAVIERLRALIRGQKFPICVKKGMKISSANITTVCLSNSNKTECKCENQYAWSSEQCSKHGVCGHSQNGTCGCIASLPTDGSFCRPPPAPLKSFKYTIDIKINASEEAVIERLRALIRGQKFPMCVKKVMKISIANITTVCLSNSNKTECKCENQYAWSFEQCSKHGVCGHSQNGKCGCIASLPTDGSFCRPPPASLKLFKYTIDIKINASKEAVIERLRVLIRGQKFPICVKKGMKISSANITTVCLSNSSKTECKCENQYAWSSEQCSKHGVCGHSQNGTCGCIASLPTNGAFCRPPPAPLKSFKYTIDIKINASKEAVIERLRALIRGQKFPICVKKGMKISSANITTVCLSNSSKTECKCENQYSWSSEQCSKHGVCGHSQNGTCGCIASLPTDGSFCRPPPAPLKSFKYTIDIKINASEEAVIERLRALIRGQKFPMCVKKGMKISSANITTVCLSNSNKTECKCENQYAWSSEQCSKHGVCGHSQNGTCGCIASLPTDGSFCRPPPGCPIPPTTIPNTSVSSTSTPSVPTTKNTDVTSLSTLIPNTTDRTTITSAPASTPTVQTNVTSRSTLIPNTTDSTTITSTPASTPTVQTNITSRSTLIPNTTGSTTITSTPASTPTVQTNVTSLSTLIPNTTDSTTITSAPASTPTVETNDTSRSTLIPNTTDSTTITSASASTPTVQTNVTSRSTLITNTTDGTTITSAPASTPTVQTNVTSLSTLIPNTTDSTTITSAPASTPTVLTNVTSRSTLIPNTTDSTTITSTPASTPTVQTNVTSLSTLIPNTTGSTTITSAPASTPTVLTNVTSLSTLIPNTTDSTTITSASASTPTVQTNVTSRSTLITNTTDGTTITSAPASTPTVQTNVTSLSTLIPNTTDSTTITSAPASTPTVLTNVTSRSTLIPNTTDSTTITSTPASTPTVQTNVTSLSTLIPNTTGSTTITSAPASTPTVETNDTSRSTLIPNTTDSTTITSASASTPTVQTNVTSRSTLITNTTDGTTITSTPASTPTVRNVTSRSTLIPNTTDSTTITSAPASTPTVLTNGTSRSTLITNTTDSTTITSAPASTPTVQTRNVTSLSTLIPNTTDSTTITSASASTPTVLTTNVTSRSTLITNTTDSTTIASTPASTPKVETKFTIPSAPNTTESTTAVTSALMSTSTTVTSQSTTTKPPTPVPTTKATTALLTTNPPTAPPPTTKPVTTNPPTAPPPTTKPVTTKPPTAPPPTTKPITTKPPTAPPPTTKPITTKPPTAPPPTTKPITTKPPTAPPPTTKPITTKPPIATTTAFVKRQISLSIDEIFDASLNNPNTGKFKKYKSDIEKAIKSSYKDVKGFMSATVTGFRPGSVIVDFFITSAEVIQITGEINKAISNNMKDANFNVDPTSVAETDNTNLRPRDPVFPEQDIILSCPATNLLGNVDWKFQGEIVQQSSHYRFSLDRLNLTVKSVTIRDNGRYECVYNTTTGLHITWDRIDYIKPYPSLQVPTNKTYKCEKQLVELVCCVHSDYSIQWVQDTKMLSSKADSLKCITQQFNILSESSCVKNSIFTCKLDNTDLHRFSYSSRAVELIFYSPLPSDSTVTCSDKVYGFGKFGDPPAVGDCEKNKVGFREGVCQSSGFWKTVKDNCVLRIIDALEQESKVVDPATLTDFVIKVKNATTVNSGDVVQSQATVSTIVGILNNIAGASQTFMLDEVVLTSFLTIVDVISSESAKHVWVELNSNAASKGNSSQLLNSIENVIKATSDTNFNITSPSNSFLFKKVTTSVDFRDVLRLNSTAEIFIPDITSTLKNVTITAVAFSSLGNVMPARNFTDNLNETENVINGLIVVVITSKPINNIELSFEKLGNTVTRNNNSVKLGKPQCAFWEFNLFNRTGGWDSTGCQEVKQINDIVTCHCNHTTSFSILMSPDDAPEDLALSVITYVGVAISIASLVVCLIIEMIIWKEISKNSTSYMRHVSLVNIALSLLIADICFIIGAAIAKPGEDYINSCSAAVFFTHFFYLALFFWMMVSALLLLYRTIVVFAPISTSVMMAVAFVVGYGAPLLISVITVASTAGSQKYVTQNGTCWLNWDISRTLLAFVIPALVIVFVNIIVVIIVMVKMLRGRVGESSRDEKNILMVILRSVAILTPLFGITWGLGLGIVIQPKAVALHYLFTIFNSLQGFLILVLGLLVEKRVRQTLKARFSRLTGPRASHVNTFS
ncbi:unnamed protein product [Leuciscus chuanchicus]